MWRRMLAVILVGLGARAPLAVGADKELTVDLGGTVSLKLLRIPAGSFPMGSPRTAPYRTQRNERPQHEVRIPADFYMGRCEVTRGQFAAFVRDAEYKTEAEVKGWAFAWDGKKWDKIKGASWKNVGFDQTDDHPVICVSWNDATAFCNWLSRRAGRTVRLPTEAQWEYACRAGTTTAWSWGDDSAKGKGRCNAADKTGRARFRSWRIFPWEDGYVFTSPVGTFKPNEYGLHDMHGNVWEWCRDWYRKSYATAGKVEAKGRYGDGPRVVRGGSWLSPPERCRSAFRTACGPMGFYCDFIIGFRVVADVVPAAKARSRPAAVTSRSSAAP